MSKKLFSLLALLTVASLLLVACGAPTEAPSEEAPAEEPSGEATTAPEEATGPQVVIAAGDPIRIGISSGLTGPIPDLGADTANGALLAIDDLNAAGGIMGHLFESDLQDGACDGDQGTVVGNYFAADPTIVAVQGGLCTGETLGVREVLEPARIPLVTASATGSNVTGAEWTIMNRTPIANKAQADFAADFFYNELGLRTIALMNDSSSYGLDLAELVGEAFTALGGTVTSNSGYQEGDTNFRDILNQIGTEGVEAIYDGGYATEAGLIADQLVEVGMADVVFMTGDGSYTQQYIDAASNTGAEGTYVSTPLGTIDPAAEEAWNAKYQETFGIEVAGPYHLTAYDAVLMIANGISQVAQEDADGNLVIDREALIAAIRATSNFSGVMGLTTMTGTLTCTDIGDCGGGTIQIYKVTNGAFEKVAESAPL
jgi:branched-chain amino acid transport system substrate-binding protein